MLLLKSVIISLGIEASALGPGKKLATAVVRHADQVLNALTFVESTGPKYGFVSNSVNTITDTIAASERAYAPAFDETLSRGITQMRAELERIGVNVARLRRDTTDIRNARSFEKIDSLAEVEWLLIASQSSYLRGHPSLSSALQAKVMGEIQGQLNRIRHEFLQQFPIDEPQNIVRSVSGKFLRHNKHAAEGVQSLIGNER